MKTVAGLSVLAVLLSSGAAAQIDVDNRRLKVDPSGSGTPEYDESIEERNRRAREAAEREGGTHIDTTYGAFGDPETKSERAPARVSGEPAQAAGARQGRQDRRHNGRNRPAAPMSERTRSARASSGSWSASCFRRSTGSRKVVRLRGERPRENREEGEQSMPRTSPLPAVALPKVAAGSGLYAQVLYGSEQRLPGAGAGRGAGAAAGRGGAERGLREGARPAGAAPEPAVLAGPGSGRRGVGGRARLRVLRGRR